MLLAKDKYYRVKGDYLNQDTALIYDARSNASTSIISSDELSAKVSQPTCILNSPESNLHYLTDTRG